MLYMGIRNEDVYTVRLPTSDRQMACYLIAKKIFPDAYLVQPESKLDALIEIPDSDEGTVIQLQRPTEDARINDHFVVNNSPEKFPFT